MAIYSPHTTPAEILFTRRHHAKLETNVAAQEALIDGLISTGRSALGAKEHLETLLSALDRSRRYLDEAGGN